MHPDINFTFESPKYILLPDGSIAKKLDFLDITIILHQSGKIDTDIFYKDTDNHDYLNYESHHSNHIKRNIPYNLTKRIIVFCSNDSTVRTRLAELKEWLLLCNSPKHIIHNAKLQGPAPKPKAKDNTLPFVTTFNSNLDNHHYSLTV